MQLASIADFNIYSFTDNGSKIFNCFISAIHPFNPSIPKLIPSGPACFARSSVNILTTSAPQFYARVLGIISNA